MDDLGTPSDIPIGYRIVRGLRKLNGRLPGWRRFANKIAPPISREFVVTNGIARFAGNLSSFIDREIYLYGGYETKNIAKFIQYLPVSRRRVILDIGANVGNHSIAFSQFFEKVHAFEPNPILWEQFEANKRLNHFTEKVRLHRVGLADRNETMTLHTIDKPNMGLGTFSPVQQYDMPLQAFATCDVRKGDHIIRDEKIQGIDAIKIDVQGFEPEVLRGLRETLMENKPVVWIEVGAGTQDQLDTMADLIKIIPYRFSMSRLDTNSSPSQLPTSLIPKGDYVLVPTDF